MTQLTLTLQPPKGVPSLEPDLPGLGLNDTWIAGVNLPIRLPMDHSANPRAAKELHKIVDEIWDMTHDRRAFEKCCTMWLAAVSRYSPGAEEREAKYMAIVEEWGVEAAHKAAHGFAILRQHFVDDGGFYDLLGATYEMCADTWGAKVLGQYFTPWPIARMTAMMSMDDLDEKMATGQTISVSDCACGSGVMLLAAQSVIAEKHGRRALKRVQVFGQDIDPLCCDMARIQTRMTNIPHMLQMMVVTAGDALDQKRINVLKGAK